ncbi:MAG: ribonuclease H-like domain-containing protein [Deltaproteobacteria bacterium]
MPPAWLRLPLLPNADDFMLFSTFSHIPGIGLKTEQRFWMNGVCRWDDFERRLLPHLSASKCREIDNYLDASRIHLEKSPKFFTDLLPPARHWRIFPHFRERTAYLDIETTGASYGEDHITARTALPHAQIDLRYVLASLGYKGGLKACEKQLNIFRGELDGVDGYFAVLLWNEYVNNYNQKSLETLLAYNVLDTVNLEALMVEAYNLYIAKLPFAHDYELGYPFPPANPFQADYPTIERLRRQYGI